MACYRVTSKQHVLGHEPGAEFEADIPEVQAARLLAGGALELVAGPADPGEPEPKPEE
jgi:hypothetical protein